MRIRTVAATGIAVAALALSAAAWAQHAGHGHHRHGAPADTPGAAPAAAPRTRITMEELHANGGVPPGWRFTLPAGNAKTGREVFAKLECNKCHAVQGDFPAPPRDDASAGPELTGMGSHHPAEYFAQSILDPNAVIVTGPGYTGADGLSIMPDYRESLTAGELVDLVAYIKSLTAGGGHAGAHAPVPEREQTVGDLRIKIVYGDHGARGGHQHGAAHAGHHGGGAGAHGGSSHLMVFVTDVKTGEPVPYLPITATIHADTSAPRTVRLTPMVSGNGFHYGADVALPAATTRVVLAIGATTMRVMPSAGGRFTKPLTVTFAWRR